MGHLNSVSVDQPLPDGLAVMPVDKLDQARVLDLEATLAVTDILAADTGRSINTVTWDQNRDVLHFFAYGADEDLRSLIDSSIPADQDWDIVPAVRPIGEVEAIIEKIAADSSVLPAGVTFVSGTPAPDGASITIGVQSTSSSRLHSTLLPQEILDVPVTFITKERATTTTRVRNAAPLVAGGYMQGPASAGTMACSTGFPVLRNQDNQYNMLTADHCTDLQGASWTWGTGTHTVGRSTFQAPGDTDLELFIEPGSLSAWVFAGSYNDATSVLPIRGYVAPVGGNNVCYSGSRSGLVCSNVLESADTFNCVAAFQCYWVRWSTQSAGTPAAGNGDSGGPVIQLARRESDNTVGAYGVGAISMIPGGSSATCTGDPGSTAEGGRKCSANVGFAPLSRWASAQSTHSLVYTTS
ncbi:hypothetical protein [Microbacterium trichothecenolyticum]|nr:hypothetical protein [Microbacterium trichothecenolyticum]